MVFEEIGIIILVGVLLLGGGWLINRALRRPAPTNASYELAVEALVRARQDLDAAAAALREEGAILQQINREMASDLMVARGGVTTMTNQQDHDVRVQFDLDARRKAAKQAIPQRQVGD